MDASGSFTNRLARETSPYLLQHARNPVDWYPWGEEALAAAREQNKPIFLSIGYSACHWCHVMEHESFESAEIAQLMNQRFINIKVDREERPDLDQIYMSAVVALTGSGGWPMSVFLTPDTRPFFGGTYWPPVARYGRPGFREVLMAVHDAWETRREAVVQQARELTQSIIQQAEPEVSLERLSLETLRNAQTMLVRGADRTHGGFGHAPKFPHPSDLRVLLRCHRRFGSRDALDVVTLTLDKMARGGIYDHLGGGFARYSTDERWLVPHFEKMLYDNAQLAVVYLEAFQLTGRRDYAAVVRESLDYVLREMTQPGGGFYSTQDADSEGVEGKFFVWSRAEVMSVLGPDDGALFCRAYDVTEHGNWEHANILNLKQPLQEVARAENISWPELESRLGQSRKRLFERRASRIAPGRDDKILVNWNGLMITALAQASVTLGEPRYARAASEAVDFIIRQMRVVDGRLLHAYKDGTARFNAYLDDHAALIEGLVELAQAVAEPRYLEIATELADQMLARFWDQEDAGFYYTAVDHESLIARTKDLHDNATPSGNNLAAMALLKLGRLLGREDYEQRAAATLDLMTGTLQRVPQAAGQALIAFDFLLGPTHEIVVCPGGEGASGAEVRRLAGQRFLPNKVLIERPASLSDTELPATLAPLLAGKTTLQGRTTVYICENGTCKQPVTDAAIESALQDLVMTAGT